MYIYIYIPTHNLYVFGVQIWVLPFSSGRSIDIGQEFLKKHSFSQDTQPPLAVVLWIVLGDTTGCHGRHGHVDWSC